MRAWGQESEGLLAPPDARFCGRDEPRRRVAAGAALATALPLRVAETPPGAQPDQATAVRLWERGRELCGELAAEVAPFARHGVSVRIGGGDQGMVLEARITEVEIDA